MIVMTERCFDDDVQDVSRTAGERRARTERKGKGEWRNQGRS